jgi:hypothetical protein
MKPVPWDIRRHESSVRLDIAAPVGNAWEEILDAIHEEEPRTVYLPPDLPGASKTDTALLRLLGVVLAAAGILVLPLP